MDMNVTDKRMLEQMQLMAAGMASSVPQLGANTDQPAKIDKSESFQDVMDRTRAQQTEAPKQDSAVEKTEPKKKVELNALGEPPGVPMDGVNAARINMDNSAAALVFAGYAQVEELYDDGTALIAPTGEKTAVALAFDGNEALANENGIYPVVITDPAGIKTTVTPEQLQQIFDQNGLSGPQNDGETTLVWQMDLENKAVYQEPVLQAPQSSVTANGMFDPYNGSDPDKLQALLYGSQEDEPNTQSLALDSSLFRSAEAGAAPVKVGDNFQLDVEQSELDEKLAQTIRAAAQEGLREIEIKLSPENLGSLTVKLTQSVDGTLQVVLRAADSKALDLLTQHLDGLKLALQGYSQNQDVQVTVQRGDSAQQSQQQFQQADPDGHNQQQQQQQRQERQEYSEDFVQKLRLGLAEAEDDEFLG